MTVYVPDPDDDETIWSYTAWGAYDRKAGFSRLFVAKEFEVAIQPAFQGQPQFLNQLNKRTGFVWYYVIKDERGKAIGVLRIKGNKRENFRDYKLGSRKPKQLGMRLSSSRRSW